MEIQDFISLFKNIYGRIPNTRRFDINEPKTHNRQSFCRELLAQIATNENLVLLKDDNKYSETRSLTTFGAYSSGAKPFRPVAILIKDQLDLTKFLRFLVHNIKQDDKDTLLSNFQGYFKSTTKRSLFCSITRVWREIINNEAKKPDGRRKKTNPCPDVLSEYQTTPQPSSGEMHSSAVDRYTIDEKEKSAIIKSCELVLQELRNIKRMTDTIDKKQRELKDSSTTEFWEERLQYELDHLTSKLENRYVELADLCADMISLLDLKKHLHKSMAKLSEVAHKLVENHNQYKITSPESFRYNALILALSDFESYFNRLKHDWNTV